MEDDWSLISKRKTIKEQDKLKDVIIAKKGDKFFYLPENIEQLRLETIKIINDVVKSVLKNGKQEYDAIKKINRKFGYEKDSN